MIKKIIKETWPIITAIVFLTFVACILISGCVKEVEKVGAKNILEILWEGK